MKFNVNHNVKVKLTTHGHMLLEEQYATSAYARIKNSVNGQKYKYVPPKEDKDGWSRWQLWSLMSSLGQHLGCGSRIPFETEIELEI